MLKHSALGFIVFAGLAAFSGKIAAQEKESIHSVGAWDIVRHAPGGEFLGCSMKRGSGTFDFGLMIDQDGWRMGFKPMGMRHGLSVPVTLELGNTRTVLAVVVEGPSGFAVISPPLVEAIAAARTMRVTVNEAPHQLSLTDTRDAIAATQSCFDRRGRGSSATFTSKN
jgi:hypothetical protein